MCQFGDFCGVPDQDQIGHTVGQDTVGGLNRAFFRAFGQDDALLVGSGASHQLFYQCHDLCISIRWASVGFVQKEHRRRYAANVRKKNGAGDVSTSFFETLLCTPSLHAHFFPHYPGKSPIFSSKTRNHRTATSQPATAPSPTASSPVRPPRRFRTRRTCDGEDTLARNAHNAHNSRFSFFAFTPSRTHHKQLIHRLLSVKTFISDTFTRLHPLFAPSSAHAGTSHRAPMGHRTDKRRR